MTDRNDNIVYSEQAITQDSVIELLRGVCVCGQKIGSV